MQPMGRLSMPSKCLEFFSFEFWGCGGGGFFSFFLYSLQVPNGFPHQVLNIKPHPQLIDMKQNMERTLGKTYWIKARC
jgi:hypothetical protein